MSSFDHHNTVWVNKAQEDGSGCEEQASGVGGCPHDVTGKKCGHAPMMHRQGWVRRAGGVAASSLPVFKPSGKSP